MLAALLGGEQDPEALAELARGKNKAIVAVAHSVLVVAYHILTNKRPYSDLGADYFDTLNTARGQRLEQLGYTVTLTPLEAA